MLIFTYIFNASKFPRVRWLYDITLTSYEVQWYSFWYQWIDAVHTYALVANIGVSGVPYGKSREGVATTTLRRTCYKKYPWRTRVILCHTNLPPCPKAREYCVSSLHKCSLFSSNWPKFTNSLFTFQALIVCGNWTPEGLQTDVNGLFAILGTPVPVILPLAVAVPLVLGPVKLVTICVKFPWEINPSGKPVADVFTLDTTVTFPVLVPVLIHTSDHWH